MPRWYVHNPFGTLLLGPNTVAGSARGTQAFLGGGSCTSITLVPKGIRGYSPNPAPALHN
eukprot:1161573-Pyramimonas_sp.AAC.1